MVIQSTFNSLKKSIDSWPIPISIPRFKILMLDVLEKSSVKAIKLRCHPKPPIGRAIEVADRGACLIT